MKPRIVGPERGLRDGKRGVPAHLGRARIDDDSARGIAAIDACADRPIDPDEGEPAIAIRHEHRIDRQAAGGGDLRGEQHRQQPAGAGLAERERGIAGEVLARGDRAAPRRRDVRGGVVVVELVERRDDEAIPGRAIERVDLVLLEPRR